MKDRAATRASVDRILEWPISRVLPVHGEAIEIDVARLAPKLVRSYGYPPALHQAALPAGDRAAVRSGVT